MRPLVTVLSSMAPKDVLQGAAAQYSFLKRATVKTRHAGGVDVVRQIEAGEVVDIVVLASDAIEKLSLAGHVLTDHRTDLMLSGIGAAVRAGATHPPIKNEVAVKNAVLHATSISYSTGPSGRYLESLFERWGLMSVLRERIVIPPPGVGVASLIAEGQVELGFQQLSELVNAPGIDLIGPLPDPIQLMTTFSAGILTRSEVGGAAHEFVRFLASPLTDPLKLKHGMSAALRP